MKLIANIARILLGIVFIYSGFVKGIDPLGSTYKLTDYFNAFSISWLSNLSFIFSILLAAAEFTIGMCLVLKVKLKITSWLALIFMIIFTPLTLFIAIKNPVSDCGCFGDALVLNNWDTFFKNIVLVIFAIITFLYKKKYNKIWLVIDQYFWLFAIIISIMIASIYSYKHLPLIDFRPYKIGTNLTEATILPKGVPMDEYKSIFKYKNLKTGEIKEFNESNYPWQDTLNWEYSEIRQELIKEGYRPQIHDFSIIHPYNGDITEQLLDKKGYTFMLISYNIDNFDTSRIEDINKLAAYSQFNNIDFYCITASLEDTTSKFSKIYNTNYEFCNMDETQLKTIIRSNPGLVLLHNGTIINKWHNNDIPNIENIKDKNLLAYCISENEKHKNKQFIFIIILVYLLGLAVYTCRKLQRRQKNRLKINKKII